MVFRRVLKTFSCRTDDYDTERSPLCHGSSAYQEEYLKNPTGQILMFSFCILISSTGLLSLDFENHEIRQYIHNIKLPDAPVMVDDFIVFTQAPSHYVRYIGITFQHEEFREIHVFKKNRHGVFFLVYPTVNIPEQQQEIVYRMVKDGLWMTDPFVEDQIRDERGIRLSVLRLSKGGERKEKRSGPVGNGYVEFIFKTSANSRVSVIGDFNHWNPFAHPLMENEPGVYSARIRTSPGQHRYTYVVNGRLVDLAMMNTRPEDRVFVESIGRKALLLMVD